MIVCVVSYVAVQSTVATGLLLHVVLYMRHSVFLEAAVSLCVHLHCIINAHLLK